MPKNPSMSTFRLAEKGHIMDSAKPENAKNGNYYMLTSDGISYVETYIAKDDPTEKKKTRAKTKKTTNLSPEYEGITSDDLNAKNYPAVKSFSGSKEQVIMAMYIVVNEGKGEWFSIDDAVHFLINIFEVSATAKKVRGIIDRNKSMFTHQQDPNNKRGYRWKLLSGAKDFAQDLIAKSNIG